MNMNHSEWVDILRSIDPTFEQYAGEFNDHIINQESEIPKKYKELILMACSAIIRHKTGIRERGYEAMHHGASDKEIIEALALASLVNSFSTLSEGINALADQFTIPLANDPSNK